MDEANFYWTVVVGVVGAIWVIVTFVRERIAQSVDRSSDLVTRLMEFDKLNIENPGIQQYLSKNAAQPESYFRSDAVLDDLPFFKAKTLVYNQLNLFDEILSVSSTSKGWTLIRPAALVEASDWEKYMIEKMRHPLCRSILNHEQHIFGASLRDFWNSHKETIEAKGVDPFLW